MKQRFSIYLPPCPNLICLSSQEFHQRIYFFSVILQLLLLAIEQQLLAHAQSLTTVLLVHSLFIIVLFQIMYSISLDMCTVSLHLPLLPER